MAARLSTGGYGHVRMRTQVLVVLDCPPQLARNMLLRHRATLFSQHGRLPRSIFLFNPTPHHRAGRDCPIVRHTVSEGAMGGWKKKGTPTAHNACAATDRHSSVSRAVGNAASCAYIPGLTDMIPSLPDLLCGRLVPLPIKGHSVTSGVLLSRAVKPSLTFDHHSTTLSIPRSDLEITR